MYCNSRNAAACRLSRSGSTSPGRYTSSSRLASEIKQGGSSPRNRNASRAAFNWPLHEVHNGEEAIAYLKGDEPYSDRDKFPLPAVMLLDLNMPMKNGFDVLRWVRTQAGLKRLSIIVLSASMRTQDVELAFDLGAGAFRVKPGAIEELTDMMRCLRDWLRYNHFPSLNQTGLYLIPKDRRTYARQDKLTDSPTHSDSR